MNRDTAKLDRKSWLIDLLSSTVRLYKMSNIPAPAIVPYRPAYDRDNKSPKIMPTT